MENSKQLVCFNGNKLKHHKRYSTKRRISTYLLPFLPVDQPVGYRTVSRLLWTEITNSNKECYKRFFITGAYKNINRITTWKFYSGDIYILPFVLGLAPTVIWRLQDITTIQLNHLRVYTFGQKYIHVIRMH